MGIIPKKFIERKDFMAVFIPALKRRNGPDFRFITLIKLVLIGFNIEKCYLQHCTKKTTTVYFIFRIFWIIKELEITVQLSTKKPGRKIQIFFFYINDTHDKTLGGFSNKFPYLGLSSV